MTFALFKFMEDNKPRIVEGICEKMRQHVADEDMPEDALRDLVSRTLEAFIDLTVTGQTDEFEAVCRSLLPAAAAHPSRLSGVLHLPLVIGDVIRRAYAGDVAASAPSPAGSRQRRQALLSIDANAGEATRAMFDAFQSGLGRSAAPFR